MADWRDPKDEVPGNRRRVLCYVKFDYSKDYRYLTGYYDKGAWWTDGFPYPVVVHKWTELPGEC